MPHCGRCLQSGALAVSIFFLLLVAAFLLGFVRVFRAVALALLAIIFVPLALAFFALALA